MLLDLVHLSPDEGIRSAGGWECDLIGNRVFAAVTKLRGGYT